MGTVPDLLAKEDAPHRNSGDFWCWRPDLKLKGEYVKKTILLVGIAGARQRSPLASPNGGPLGDFEAHGDVGSPKIAGYATYNGATQVYTLSAGGVNIWAKRDEFQFAYRRMKGDFIVQAHGGVPGQGRRSASQGRHHGARLDHRLRFTLRRRRIARRRADIAAVPQGQGRRHRADRDARRQGRERHPARAPWQSLHPVGGAFRRAFRSCRDQGRELRARRSLRRPVPLLAQSGRQGDRRSSATCA